MLDYQQAVQETVGLYREPWDYLPDMADVGVDAKYKAELQRHPFPWFMVPNAQPQVSDGDDDNDEGDKGGGGGRRVVERGQVSRLGGWRWSRRQVSDDKEGEEDAMRLVRRWVDAGQEKPIDRGGEDLCAQIQVLEIEIQKLRMTIAIQDQQLLDAQAEIER